MEQDTTTIQPDTNTIQQGKPLPVNLHEKAKLFHLAIYSSSIFYAEEKVFETTSIAESQSVTDVGSATISPSEVVSASVNPTDAQDHSTAVLPSLSSGLEATSPDVSPEPSASFGDAVSVSEGVVESSPTSLAAATDPTVSSEPTSASWNQGNYFPGSCDKQTIFSFVPQFRAKNCIW